MNSKIIWNIYRTALLIGLAYFLFWTTPQPGFLGVYVGMWLWAENWYIERKEKLLLQEEVRRLEIRCEAWQSDF